MKAALVLTSLLFIVALMSGCSDNLGINEPFNQESIPARDAGDERNTRVVCEFDELSVYAAGEYFIENKAVYTNPPFSMISDYWVTFDVFTDADKLTNGYIPQVQILMDKEIVFESSEYPGSEGAVTAHVKVPLENVRFTDLTICISLMQTDGPVVRNEDQQTTLKLSKITIYKED